MRAAAASVERLLGPAGVGQLALGAGRATLPLALPASEGELVEVVRLAARDDLCLLPLGTGAKLGWCRAPRGVDLAVSTRALRGVVAYEPGDGTLTALAGSRMDELAAAVRAGGHHLTPDVARPGGATLGGVLAAGQSGIDRLRHGPARGHVLGARVVEADGTVTKSGGRLVKNVTGYDLQRLYCGSHGTLCILLEASLRLFPLPEHTALVTARSARPEQALAAARALRALRLQPLAVCVENLRVERAEAPWALHALLAGRAAQVAWEREQVARALGAAEVLEGEPAEALRDELRDLEPAAAETTSLHVACRPSALEEVWHLCRDALGRRECAPAALLHPGLATLDLPVVLSTQALAQLVRELRAALAPHRARLSVRGAGVELPDDLDPFGEPGPGFELMQRLRARLDPRGRFAAGRFHGGL